MTISARDWLNYVQRLSRLNKTAGAKMEAYIERYGTKNTEALIDYANALATHYGEGSAELACQMYDEIASAAGKHLPAAEPADTASYGEVARAIYGTLGSPPTMRDAVSRLVKRTGADTTLKNALRDGAEWAWVPQGDTCAFCLTLASRGWQRASRKALKGGHAQHIHAHCDCSYAIRFDSGTDVAGYDPDKYLKMYENAEGDTPGEKINSMRRAQRERNKEWVNAQQREAYHARKALEADGAKTITLRATRGSVTAEYIKAAKPGSGSIVLGDGYQKDTHPEEVKIAQWLHDNLGGDVTLLREVNEDKVKTPDYLWNEKLWDLKTISSEKAANSAVRHGFAQIQANPGGIILDLGDLDFSEEKLWSVVDKRMGWYDTDGNIDILVLSKGKLVSVRRY